LLAFFGALSLADVESTRAAASFRITPGAKSNAWPLAAWVRRGEIAAEDRGRLPRFDHDAFVALLPSVRDLTCTDDFWPALRDHCASAGVLVLVEPALKNSGANGVTFWRSDDAPVIQLSLRYKRTDIFWFTFFHEAAHVLQGYRPEPRIDLDQPHTDDPDELAADRIARDLLIPRDRWSAFRSTGGFGEVAVRRFAEEIGVHPGIVVGRLQHDGLIGQGSRLNRLRATLSEDAFALSD